MGCSQSASAPIAERPDVFISHTQRDADAHRLALDLSSALQSNSKRCSCWLDLKRRDDAVRQRAAQSCGSFVVILSDNGTDSYFGRARCLEEARWAQRAGVPRLAIVSSADRQRAKELVAASSGCGLDLVGVPIFALDSSGRHIVLPGDENVSFALSLDELKRQCDASGAGVEGVVLYDTGGDAQPVIGDTPSTGATFAREVQHVSC